MQYYEPNFLNEGLVLLDRYGSRARVLAGGTLVGPQLRLRSSDVEALVNIKRIADLARVSLEPQGVYIGALVTAAELAQHALVKAHAPLIALAASSLGARQLRNVATLGGNVLSGHPAADLAAALLASDARCLIASLAEHEREVPVAELLEFESPALATGELLAGVRITALKGSSAYQKMTTRRAFEMAIVAVAVRCEFQGDRVAEVSIALGGAASTPIRASSAEAALKDHALSAAAAQLAGQRAAQSDAKPVSDKHASADYRRHLVSVLTQRALLEIMDERRAGAV